MPHGAETYREILNRLPSAIFTFTPEFEVVWANRTTADLVPQAMPGANLYQVLGAVANEEKLDRLLLRGEKVMFSAGEGLPLLEWLINDGNLADGSLILMAWDPMITDEMVRRRATFAMAAAHELRSPLTALIGFAEIFDMERDNLNPAQVEAVSVIRENSLYLQTLVNDILDLTSNSFGELTLDLVRVDASEPVLEATDSLKENVESRGQRITVELQADLPEVEVDRRRLRQVVENLVRNASIHNPAGTLITVTTSLHNDGVVIAVEDDGRGIPFDPPELAFGSFRHGGAIDFGQMTGSGIGLTVSKRLVELHRGRISVESSATGSRFEVCLPLDRANTFTRVPPGPA